MDTGSRQGGFIKASLFLISLVLMIFLISAPAFSQIYKWKDKKGNTHFSDSPPQGVKAKEVDLKRRGADSAKSENTRKSELKGRKSNRDVKVIMYMTDVCGYCKKARDYLNSLGVNLVEYNVEKDREKAAESIRKGGRGVPVIDIEGTIIRGYNPERIKEAVEKKRG